MRALLDLLQDLADWFRDLFAPDRSHLLRKDPVDVALEVMLEERRREDEVYRRSPFGAMARRGHALADGVNRGLRLPPGVVVFDETEVREEFRKQQREAN